MKRGQLLLAAGVVSALLGFTGSVPGVSDDRSIGIGFGCGALLLGVGAAVGHTATQARMYARSFPPA